MNKKRTLPPLAAAALLSLACSLFIPLLPTDIPAADTATPVLSRDFDDRGIFAAGLIASQQTALDGLPGASVYHLDLEINPDLYHLEGLEEVRYTNLEEIALAEIHVRLFPNVLGGEMDVASVRVDGQPVTPTFGLARSLMRVPLPETLSPDESVILRVEFSVTVPQELERNYGVLASYDGVLALAHAYPMIAVYDDEGWNEELPPEQGDVTYADVAFFLVNVTARRDLVMAASGREVQRRIDGSRQIVTYAAGPARDFYLAASEQYEVITQTVGEVTVNSYAPADLRAGSERALALAAQALEALGQRYGAYPYTEFDLVATPTSALGIEYPGIIALAGWMYDLDVNLFGAAAQDLLEAVVVHEAGHQWFYSLVGNDQLDEPWLDESLTQFVTLQYYADVYGPLGASGFRQELSGRWSAVGFAEIPIGSPVAAYTDFEYSAIVYGRGALFFEALRAEMGQDAFDAFLQEYVARHAWGIATTESLRSLAEANCGCDLTALFEEWVYP